MILSYHPLFEADKNMLCAGRLPGAKDLAAMQAAKAVILPQGCSRRLYEMAKSSCEHIFPNYDVRFEYPGKIGQIKLFRATATPHPVTELFPSTACFYRQYGDASRRNAFPLPLVFKFDWGGEGDTVFPVRSHERLRGLLQRATQFEKKGQAGFLLQQFVPTGASALRVVIIGDHRASYWRIQQNPDAFKANLSAGACIDAAADPDLQAAGVAAVNNFCGKTGVNLAGFDVIFATETESRRPLLLEINYFFGRRGLGGSRAYYTILQKEIQHWLAQRGLVQ